MQESAGCSSKRMAHVCHRDAENATQNTPRTTKEQNDERKRNRLRNRLCGVRDYAELSGFEY